MPVLAVSLSHWACAENVRQHHMSPRKNYTIDFDEFIKQLSNNEKLNSLGSLVDSISNYENQFPDKSTYIPKKGFEKVLATLLQSRIEMLINELYTVTEECESPIEVILLYGLLIYGADYFDTVNVRVKESSLFKIGDSPYELMIEPQKKILNYRVDFLVTATDYHPDINPNGYSQTQIIVECDGKKYHSSPEQKIKDQKRDDALLKLGYKTYRYTGSTIWSEVFEAIKEILNTVCKKDVA